MNNIQVITHQSQPAVAAAVLLGIGALEQSWDFLREQARRNKVLRFSHAGGRK